MGVWENGVNQRTPPQVSQSYNITLRKSYGKMQLLLPGWDVDGMHGIYTVILPQAALQI